jgi:2-oxoglutarate ferredoxin oxidoreductase subunit alpha
MVDTTLTIAGQAGQGIDTASELLARALGRAGYSVFSYPNLMSRIRGGHNFSAVRISDRPVLGLSPRHNVLLAMDELSVTEHRAAMVADGVIVAEPRPGQAETAGEFRVPMAELAAKHGGSKTMANVVGLGAVLALTGHPLDELLNLLKERFEAKGGDVVKQNLGCCRAGADFVKQQFGGTCACAVPGLREKSKRLLMTGNQAVALGALASGVRFYAGYPMSPATPIMEYLAGRQADFNIVLEQVEDEIAAVNMIVGAGYAGARAMTATSGGGFSLMVEGLGMAAMAEVPIVIVIAQRAGPATGFPTRTEQADLLYVLNTSQDEFPRFVFAPGTAEEAFYATNRAFELANQFQAPAIVLTDQMLADSLWTVPGFNLGRVQVSPDFEDKAWQSRPAYSYHRYAATPDGVSPRIRPGLREQVVRALGAEHTEEGFQTEDAGVRVKMQEKRMRKLARMSEALDDLTCFPDEDECMVVCFGSTYGVAREAVDILRQDKVPVGMVHLAELCPFPRERVLARLSKARRVISVEMNSTGQLATLLARETRIKVSERVLKYDGRPFVGQELAEELRGICK